jgi:hypothetical protein
MAVSGPIHPAPRAANGARLEVNKRIQKRADDPSAFVQKDRPNPYKNTPQDRQVSPVPAGVALCRCHPVPGLSRLSLEVLSSVRAYVGGESLWSKGQKDAVHFLTLYSRTGEEQYFHKFKSAVAVPLADRVARTALERETPDLDAAHDGFIGGGNHAADVPGLIRLFRYFREVPYMARAIAYWRATDPFLDN